MAAAMNAFAEIVPWNAEGPAGFDMPIVCHAQKVN